MLDLLNNTFSAVVAGSLSISFILLFLVKDTDTPKWLDVFTGLMLIATSALFLGLLQDLLSMVTVNSDESNQAKKLIIKYQVAILILPFVSAAIGTNLISHALTADRDYRKVSPINVTLKKIPLAVLKAVLLLSLVGLLPWAIYVFSEKRKNNLTKKQSK